MMQAQRIGLLLWLLNSVGMVIVNGHVAAWNKGMYCLNGTSGEDNPNTNDAVLPLYQLLKKDWWFHHENGCDEFPPAEGNFLELPAGGQFTVELANNRGQTSFSFNGQFTSEWPDGGDHPGGFNDSTTCITAPNIHTQNQSMAAGTVFAISYESGLDKVTPENLVVFTARHNTPWKRLTTYDVPAAMPACPSGGCICAWGWVPNGCGIPNMYHLGYKCRVTGATSTTPVGIGRPPVWCEDDQTKCVPGPKQMIYWNQLEGNNVEVEGYDLSGSPKSPAYNQKCGFQDGAQNDIFTVSVTSQPPSRSEGKPSSQINHYHSNLATAISLSAAIFVFTYSF